MAYRRSPRGPRLTRRRILGGTVLLGAVASGLDAAGPLYDSPLPLPPAEPGPVRIGASFSQVEAEYMGLDWQAAYLATLELQPAFLRIGAYWNRIERQQGQFDFSELDWMLLQAERRSVPITLAFGIKAPVYPEFHIPSWAIEDDPLPAAGLLLRSPRLRERGHTFTSRVIYGYASEKAITRLQVENEPFEPILFKNAWTLDESYLRRQVALVREADRLQRPIVLNVYVPTSTAVNALARVQRQPVLGSLLDLALGRRPYQTLIELADVIGLDVFPSVGWTVLGQKVYFRPHRPGDFNLLRAWRRDAARAGKPVIVVEAQAKPWEPDRVVHIGERRYPSFDHADIAPFLDELVAFGIREIGVWGVEHWFWHRSHGDPAWWQAGRAAIRRAHLSTPALAMRRE